MNNKVRIELNKAGIKEFLKNDVIPILEQRASEVAARSGIRTTKDIKQLSGRAVAGVFSEESEFDDAANRQLMAAIDEGEGA